jgi:hypothetical protein
MLSFPCGRVDDKHSCIPPPIHRRSRSSDAEAAAAELSEEAHLCGGELVPLIAPDHPGVLEVKWGSIRFVPYVVIDPVIDPNPRPRDAEGVLALAS